MNETDNKSKNTLSTNQRFLLMKMLDNDKDRFSKMTVTEILEKAKKDLKIVYTRPNVIHCLSSLGIKPKRESRRSLLNDTIRRIEIRLDQIDGLLAQFQEAVKLINDHEEAMKRILAINANTQSRLKKVENDFEGLLQLKLTPKEGVFK